MVVHKPLNNNLQKHKAVIIEFVGPPGAGKTTSCRSFAQLLKKKGLNVCLLQDIKNYIKQESLARKIILLLKFILFRGVDLFLFMVSLAYHRIYSIDSIYRYIRLTLFDLALQQFQKTRKPDVFLLEQWIIQELWSATIFKIKSYDKISKRLSRFYFRSDIIVYLDLDATTASERLSLRDTKLSRFDKMDEIKRVHELIKYNRYLFQLYKNSDCKQKHLFSGYDSPEKNIAAFTQHLNIPISH